MMPGLSGKSGQLCEFSGRWLCTGSTVPVSDSEVDSQAEGAVLMALLKTVKQFAFPRRYHAVPYKR